MRRARASASTPSMCSQRTPDLDELVADVDAVRDVDGEGDGLPALAVLVPVRDDVADQLRPIHAIGELGLDVVAVTRAHAAQIGIDRRIDARRHQDSRARSASGDLRAFDHRLEDAAEPAPVAAAWRCGQAEQHRVGIGVDDLAIGLRRRVVASSITSRSARRQIHRFRCAGCAPMQGLDRGDLHQFQRPRLNAGLMMPCDRCRARAACRLVCVMISRRCASTSTRFCARVVGVDDVGADDGLAAAGRRHQDDATLFRRRPRRETASITSRWYGRRSGAVMRHPIASADAAGRLWRRSGSSRRRSAARRP